MRADARNTRGRTGGSPTEGSRPGPPFPQIGSRLARRYAGTGLGLPLTKALVDLHGGALRIESAPGRGTTVTVALLQYSPELEERTLAAAGD